MNSFKTRKVIQICGKNFFYFSLDALEKQGIGGVRTLPFSLKVLLENLLRSEDGEAVTKWHIKAVPKWNEPSFKRREIAISPTHLLLEKPADILAVMNLIKMTQFAQMKGWNDFSLHYPSLSVYWQIATLQTGDPEKSKEPLDSLVQQATSMFTQLSVFENNLTDFGGKVKGVVFQEEGESSYLFPESFVGTGSGIGAAGALGILALRIGSLEAEAVLLNQPAFLSLPDIIGFKLEGILNKKDAEKKWMYPLFRALAEKEVTGKWVEFYGQGLDQLSCQDRMFVAERVMELGACSVFFPIDQEVVRYVSDDCGNPDQADLIQQYALAQGLWRDDTVQDPIFSETLCLNLSEIGENLTDFSVFFKKEAVPVVSYDDLALDAFSLDPVSFFGSLIDAQNLFPLNQVKVWFPDQALPLDIENKWMIVAGENASPHLTENRRLRNLALAGMQGVIATSFDDHYRADLISSGMLPLLFKFGMSKESLMMEGNERLDFVYLSSRMKPGMDILCRMTRKTGESEEFMLALGIQTKQELIYFQQGGVLGYVLAKLQQFPLS